MKYGQDKSKEKFAERLNKACEEAGIKYRGRATYIQSRMSEKISLVGIRKWLIGEAIPTTKRLGELANIVQTSVEYLIGTDDGSTNEVREKAPVYDSSQLALRPFEVPLINWSNIDDWLEHTPHKLPKDCKKILCPNTSASLSTFALNVIGDAMTSKVGKSYPEGAIIFVDPKKSFRSGSKVIASVSKGYIFRTIVKNEFGNIHLTSLNSDHKPIFEDEITIIGVVIGCYFPD
jgi:SOS-response transcriptional repressor LexA